MRAVIYLVFNEGYAASGGGRLIHADLCEEAIWLGRLLHRMLPDDTETAGLLALMLLHHSRAAARQDPGGRAVLLADQDRARWDAALADLLERAGRAAEAAAAWARAERAMGNAALQRELHRRSASAAEKELGSGSPGFACPHPGLTSLPA